MTNLRKLRLDYDISLIELEKASNVSNQYISQLELGAIPFSKRATHKVAQAIETIIRSREEKLRDLKAVFEATKDSLLQECEVQTPHE